METALEVVCLETSTDGRCDLESGFAERERREWD